MLSFLIALWLNDNITVLTIHLLPRSMFTVCYSSINPIQIKKFPCLSSSKKQILPSFTTILHIPNLSPLLIALFKNKLKNSHKNFLYLEAIVCQVSLKTLKEFLSFFRILESRFKNNWNLKTKEILCRKLMFLIKFYPISSSLKFLNKFIKIHKLKLIYKSKVIKK